MIAQLDSEYMKIARTRTLVRLASYGLFEGRPATTKGRCVNGIVATQLRVAARFWRNEEVDRPVFVVGMGRSGTTILGNILGIHRKVGFLNEPKLLWQMAIDTQDVTGCYAQSGRFRLDASDVSDTSRARMRKMYAWYTSFTRSQRVVDKYPEAIFRLKLIREIFPDAKVIAIARHADPVVRSITQWDDLHRTGLESWWGIRDAKWSQMLRELVPREPRVQAILATREISGVDRAVVEWIVSMREVLQARDAGVLNGLIRYEDFVADPRRVISGILESAELECDKRVMQLSETVVASREWTGKLASPYDESWLELTSPILHALGYRA